MSAERVALERLVEECEAVLGRLGELPERDLEASGVGRCHAPDRLRGRPQRRES